MENHVDNFGTEVAVLRRKLQSKAEALFILSRELEQCRNECDQFKLIAEQAQQHSLHKTTSDDQKSSGDSGVLSNNSALTESGFDHYLEITKLNKALRYEIQDLKQKLREAYGDIKVLRAGAVENSRRGSACEITPAHQREELVEQLERMGMRVTQLEADLRSVLDEKEELVTEREAYRCKVHRLNHQINILLKVDTGKVIDIDALVMDNKYLQDQVQQLKAEKELAQQALAKYKSMLEKKRNKGSLKLGNSNNSTIVVSHKQVHQLLMGATAVQLPDTEATLDDLRSLCLALLEALQDKSLALTHQRKANKILANRISELEHRLGANVPVFPSQLLLQGYSSAHVDFDLDKVDHNITVDATLLPPTSEDTLLKDSLSELAEKLKPEPNKPMSSEVSGTESNSGSDCLPQDIQELVRKALQELKEEELKNS